MMKILYIDGGHVLHENHMYPYYGGVYRELLNLASVTTYQGFVGNINSFLSYLDQDFDCIIFGLGYFANGSINWYSKIEGLSEINIPVICLLHKPQTMLDEKLNFFRINNIDLIVDSQCTYEEYGMLTGIPSIRLPWTATPKCFMPRPHIPKNYDIGFSGALHGSGKIQGPTRNLRTRIKAALDLQTECNIFWNGSDSVTTRIPSVEQYASKINECKMWLATTGPMLDISPRYFEVALSKTMLFCNEMPQANGEMFKDGITCATFKNDLSDFDEKLEYYLKNDKERNQICQNAYDLVLGNYTWKHMALKLINKIQEVINGKNMLKS